MYASFFKTNESKFQEIPHTGIYFQNITGGFESTIPIVDRLPYSGLYIPVFKTSEITSYPVSIGLGQEVFGPAVNIGAANVTISPDEVRQIFGSSVYYGGELALGSVNMLLSGLGNVAIGHGNFSMRSRRTEAIGCLNLIEYCDSVTVHGGFNVVSGYKQSFIVGKNNYLYAHPKDNVEGLMTSPGIHPSMYSGYGSSDVRVFGDNNSLFNGAVRGLVLGSTNSVHESTDFTCLGVNNNIHKTSGAANLMIGNNNDFTSCFDMGTVGDSNTLEKVFGGLVLGASNYASGSNKTYVLGDSMSIKNSNHPTTLGSTNVITDSLGDFVFGFTNSVKTGQFNCIFGSNCHISGGTSNFIFGESISSDSVAKKTLGNSHNYLNSLSGIFEEAGSNNFFIGQNILGTLNYSTLGFGFDNKLVMNNQSFLIGKNNELVNNKDSFVFGYNNRITGSKDSIFVGFNFQSGNGTVSGLGIKISSNEINLYGTVKVNGVTLNVP